MDKIDEADHLRLELAKAYAQIAQLQTQIVQLQFSVKYDLKAGDTYDQATMEIKRAAKDAG